MARLLNCTAVSKDNVGATSGRPSELRWEFAETTGEFVAFCCRASNARPYKMTERFVKNSTGVESSGAVYF